MIKVTRVDNKCIELIERFEGFKPAPYKDIVGVNTIGIGTTRYPNGVKVSMSDLPITHDKAVEYLMSHLFNDELAVDAMAVDTITQNQFNALVSFSYNIGDQALRGSHLLMKVNSNPNDPSIRDEFAKWVFANGQKSDGLIRRRAAEAELYFLKV